MGITDEFKWVKFFLDHHNPFDFHMPRWVSVNPIILVVTRGIFAVYCIVLMVMSIVVGASEEPSEGKSPEWLIFATSWNYMFVTLYFMLAFGISLTQSVFDCRGGSTQKSPETIPINATESGPSYSTTTHDDEGKKKTDLKIKLPWKLKIFWVVFNVAINLSTLVVIAYWGLVHDYRKKLEFKLVTYLLVDRQGINFALMVVDFLLHKIPFRILHFIYPLAITVLYVIFNVIYWKISGHSVYKLDWSGRTGVSIGVVIGILLIIMIVQIVWYFLHKGKKLLAEKKSGKLLEVDAGDY